MKTITIILIIMVIFTVYPLDNLYAWVWANESEIIYDDCNNISDNIITAAGFFLKSKGNFLFFLSLFELSNNCFQMANAINSTIDNMKEVEKNFSLLTQIDCQYNALVIQKLKNFDYIAFQQENGLNSVIFGKVENFLKEGDGIGIYNKIYSEVKIILEDLNAIKSTVDSGIIPKVGKLWDLYQKYSDLMLFGEYLSMVCMEVKNSINETP